MDDAVEAHVSCSPVDSILPSAMALALAHLYCNWSSKQVEDCRHSFRAASHRYERVADYEHSAYTMCY